MKKNKLIFTGIAILTMAFTACENNITSSIKSSSSNSSQIVSVSTTSSKSESSVDTSSGSSQTQNSSQDSTSTSSSQSSASTSSSQSVSSIDSSSNSSQESSSQSESVSSQSSSDSLNSELSSGSSDNSEMSSSSSSSSSSQQQEKTILHLTDLNMEIVSPGYCPPQVNKNCLGDEFLVNGFKVNKGISMHPGETQDARIKYDISSYTYDTFVATIGRNDQTKNHKVIFKVFLDDKLKYESSLIGENQMEYIELPIDSGAKSIELVVDNGDDGISFDASTWAYPSLIHKQDLHISNLEVENINPVVTYGKTLNLNSASAVITYNTGAIERVNLLEEDIQGFNAEKLGPQKLIVTKKEFSIDYSIYVCKENESGSVGSLKQNWISYQTMYDNPSIGKDIFDGTDFAIAGYKYYDGIGLNPVSDSESAYIELDISSFNFTNFQTVVGKTRSAFNNEVIFYIYADDVEVYRSKILLAGEKDFVNLDIKGVQKLKIVADSGDDDVINDACGFGSPYFYTTYTQEEIESYVPDIGDSHEHNYVNGTCEICDRKQMISLTNLASTGNGGGWQVPAINHVIETSGSELVCNGFYSPICICMHPSSTEAYIKYDISNYDYDTFVAYVGKVDQRNSCIEFAVEVDGINSYKSSIISSDSMDYVEIDIKDAKELTLIISPSNDGFSCDEGMWAYPTLIDKNDHKVEEITLESMPYVIEQGATLNTKDASAIVKYNSGVVRRVGIDEITIENFDSSEVGLKKLDLIYYGEKFQTEILISEKVDYLVNHVSEATGVSSYFPVTVGSDCDTGDLKTLSVGGYRDVNYGLSLHPSGDGVGYIEFDVSNNQDMTHLYFVAGKARSGYAFNEVFNVYINGEKKYSSKIYAGRFEEVNLEVSNPSTIKLEVVGGDNGIAFGTSAFLNLTLYK